MKKINDIHEQNLNVLNCLKQIDIENYEYYKKELLIKEAQRRGFKEGINIIPVGYSNVQKIKNPFYIIRIDSINANSDLWEWDKNCSNPPIFKDGKWAEIIEDEIIEVNGVKYKRL